MPRVLVIDDEPQIRSLTARFLTQAGYEVEEAADGLEGVRKMKSDPADLVITDILMPKQEGLETIRQIRESFPDCKIIAMSGGSQLTAMDFLPIAEKFGASRLFHKPIDFNELVEAAKELTPPDA
jgi:CheY-like chemotaxis protein